MQHSADVRRGPELDAGLISRHGARPSEAIYALEGISKSFTVGTTVVRALREVDLEVHAGEVLVLLGPSGSGKTTLLNLLGALDVPTEGRLSFLGHDLTTASDPQLTQVRRDEIGFVFQFYNLLPTLTARENVAVVAQIAPSAVSPEEALDWMGLSERGDHFPSQLSGGEQQRVAIARALAKQPRVLLCDEPTGALDGPTGRTVLAALLESGRRLGNTVVLITHNTEIAKLADRVVHMSCGTIVDVASNATPKAISEVTW